MRACVLCGKTTKVGMDTTHKHGGQWAMRAPKSQKLWKPNLQVAKVEIEGVGVRKMRFCVKCLRQVKSGDGALNMKKSEVATKSVSADTVTA